MTTESTAAGRELLARVEALGWPSIGQSSLGRGIVAARLAARLPSGGDGGAPLLLMAGIHGDEPASVEAVLDLLASAPGAGGRAPLWVVPALNPDGLRPTARIPPATST